MKGRRVLMVSVTVVAMVVVAAGADLAAVAREPALDPMTTPSPPAGNAAAVERGAKIAALGNCITCHTTTDGRPFAGGLPIKTPFGIIYSTNITPDAETGIGRWSLDAFRRAMRQGVSRDGHLLYPAFPYPHFTHMSDGDIASLYAWLMSRDPVDALAPKNDLLFPLGFRPIMAAWNQLYLRPGPDESSLTSSDQQVARGRHLVDSLGHCGACHTPLNRFGAERGESALQGGTIEGWDAPSLTDLSSRPRPWTQAQLVNYLRNGFASEHGAAAGPMRSVTRTLADAPDVDVRAIAMYLIAATTGARASATTPVGTANINQPRDGAVLFAAACASCHGENAPMSIDGDRPSLSLGTAVNADSPRNLVRVMLEGIDWDGSATTHFMPPFATTFTDAQIADLANYTRARFSAQAPWPALDAHAVARLRKESQER